MSKPLQVNSQDPDRYTGTRVLFLSASSGMQWLHQNYPLGSGRATFSTRFDLQIGGFPSFGAPSPIPPGAACGGTNTPAFASVRMVNSSVMAWKTTAPHTSSTSSWLVFAPESTVRL